MKLCIKKLLQVSDPAGYWENKIGLYILCILILSKVLKKEWSDLSGIVTYLSDSWRSSENTKQYAYGKANTRNLQPIYRARVVKVKPLISWETVCDYTACIPNFSNLTLNKLIIIFILLLDRTKLAIEPHKKAIYTLASYPRSLSLLTYNLSFQKLSRRIYRLRCLSLEHL